MLVALLLCAHGLIAVLSARVNGVSFDEPVQLAVGYNQWINGDYRVEGANGDLIKRWSTLPYLLLRPRFLDPNDPVLLAGDAYGMGRRFLFQLGNSAGELVFPARLMLVAFSVCGAVLVYGVALQLFGGAGALVSLTLYALSPNVLASGSVVATDLTLTLTLLASVWWSWLLLHRITWGRLVCGLTSASLLVLAKPTAIIIFPITGVMIAVRLLAGRPLEVRLRKTGTVVNSLIGQTFVIVALIFVHVLAAWSTLWANYGFRYPAKPDAFPVAAVFHKPTSPDEVPAPFAVALNHLRRAQLLPEGFIEGIDTLLRTDDELRAFANGNWWLGGKPWFFPYAIWAKSNPALLLLSLIWLLAALATFSRGRGTFFFASETAYNSSPFVILAAIYLGYAMTEDVNLGVRHILPVYAAAFVLAGGVLATQPVVRIQDRYGNTVTTSTAQVTAAVESGTGSWTLGGTLLRNAVAGLATFTNLTATGSGGPVSGARIRFTAGGLTLVSNTFTIPS